MDLQPGQKIVALFEKPTKNGIIGPRSNGITSIRKYMKGLAGEGRENLTFEDFLNTIGEEKANKVPEKLKEECKGLKMWDIATGKTTIFNPFVSRKLLGGMENDPLVKVSSQIHITGNPGRKIKDGINKGESNFGAQLDFSEVKIPQIIELIQNVCDVSDEAAIKSWNMGTPYALACEETDVEKLIAKAKEHGFTAKVIGEITEKSGIGIRNVGIGKTNMTL